VPGAMAIPDLGLPTSSMAIPVAGRVRCRAMAIVQVQQVGAVTLKKIDTHRDRTYQNWQVEHAKSAVCKPHSLRSEACFCGSLNSRM
jgi:hypothetical protein